MSAAELAIRMQKYGVTEINIASATGLHPTTIKRFLDSGRASLSTRMTIARFFQDLEQEQASRKVAVG